MCDAVHVPYDTLHATFEHDDPPCDILRPKTPLPDSSRTLRRTISYASIDTICPPSSKGVRRRINEIADNLTKKKKKHSSTRDLPKIAAHGLASDSKAPPASKATKRGRKATAPLRDSSPRSEEESVLEIADRLHSGVPSELDSPLMLVRCEVDKPLAKEDEQLWEDCSFPTARPNTGVGIAGTLQSPPTPKASIKDVQLDIRPSQSDVTIWDGLRATHQLFKCRLYLRCTTHPYDGISVPDIHRIEMNCNTHPAGLRYARRLVFQTAYKGASPGWVASTSGLPNVNPAAGIHIDRFWRTIQSDDGTWGWYRDVFVPLSPRLFDKMDHREFKLVSRVWVGETCLENELTFGISMLLRKVEMK